MTEALLIIDFQNDFTPPDGALAVPEGETIAARVNELAESDRFEFVVATRDWHPPEHKSFTEHGGRWPRHCVEGTHGAELHPSLDAGNVDLVLDKGQDPETPGYSAFEEPDLDEVLTGRGIKRLTVVGLATDVCVRSSALDALQAGYEVTVDADATRGVDPDDSARTLREIEEAGGSVVRRSTGG